MVQHLDSKLLAAHLYGSALDGGLKPHSDIGLLVTVSARPDEAVRQALLLDLLEVSAPPGQSDTLRALEVTMVVHKASFLATAWLSVIVVPCLTIYFRQNCMRLGCGRSLFLARA